MLIEKQCQLNSGPVQSAFCCLVCCFFNFSIFIFNRDRAVVFLTSLSLFSRDSAFIFVQNFFSTKYLRRREMLISILLQFLFIFPHLIFISIKPQLFSYASFSFTFSIILILSKILCNTISLVHNTYYAVSFLILYLYLDHFLFNELLVIFNPIKISTVTEKVC